MAGAALKQASYCVAQGLRFSLGKDVADLRSLEAVLGSHPALRDTHAVDGTGVVHVVLDATRKHPPVVSHLQKDPALRGTGLDADGQSYAGAGTHRWSTKLALRSNGFRRVSDPVASGDDSAGG